MGANRRWVLLSGCVLSLFAAGCDLSPKSRAPAGVSFAQARSAFHTTITREEKENLPVETPPPEVFTVVNYNSPIGPMAAYLTPDPGDGQKHPAVLWITGGFNNSIGEMWLPAPPDNDQTAAAYWQAGIVLMSPSTRGGNQNPGTKEGFYGEVDDVLAAAEYLSQCSYVDPQRIYLGGHSTGGTLALLAAAASDRFRAVFAFGPVESVDDYGDEARVYDRSIENESLLRSPAEWLPSIHAPTFVIEGSEGNASSLRSMKRYPHGANVQLFLITGVDHFGTLGPINVLLAQKVLADTGPTSQISVTQGELQALFR